MYHYIQDIKISLLCSISSSH